MKKRVKLGKYKTVYSGEIFRIQQAKAVFPSGKIKTFERVMRYPTVMLLALDDKNRLLLNREYRLKLRKYTWRLPSGRVDKEKDVKKAAQRELQEETGFKSNNLKLFHLARSGQTMEWNRYTFLATNLSFSPLPQDEDEDITVFPVSITKAFQMALAGEIENELMTFVILKLYRERKKALKLK